MMSNGRGGDVCYNIQTAVDAKNKLVVEFEVTNAVNDSNLLSVMAKKAAQTLNVTKLAVVADEGYVSASDIVECVTSGFEVHAAGAEFDVCVPCGEEQAETVLSHTNGRCVYIESRLVICPMGKVLYPGNYTKTTKDTAFYNSVACQSCVCKCTTARYRRFSGSARH
jgi:hypothetical protein